MIQILSVVNYVNKAVSTLVMIVYEQDYRYTPLSMEAGEILEGILSVAYYVNRAVSTLVMIVYEQDYRGTTLSMKAGTKLEDGEISIKVIQL